MKKPSSLLTKKHILFIALLVGVISLVSYLSPPETILTSYESCEVCFSPQMRCTNRIIQYIETAEESIFVQAFVLTSFPIAESLIAASQRGVKVMVILDGKQIKTKHSLHHLLLNAGVPVHIDKIPGGLAHNKVMIFDKEIVLTGSFNFSKNAETTNAENIIIIKDEQLASHYLENWHRRFKVSAPL